ncbi:J domain-containing protein [Hymenobacter sediminis]|uniref:J domain-containing protein n=1 Tax=Hymenobacter sediminis TaxID=2218621 RepID=UPI000DA677B9|nr:J domain-containing protein [Hymenobacter sediminis]RPD49747.1 J domain-containing protein [Hymenobacter sediminis]
MSTFYATLEVSEQATPEEIRRAYRRLVLLTHPDRTPDPAAHERYLAINAAYDVLSQPARRQLYDAALAIRRRPPEQASALPPTPAPTRAQAEVRHRRAAARRRGPAPDPYAALYARYAPWGRRFCQLMLVFCALLVLDFCWTREYQREPVQSVERHSMSSRRSGSVTYYIIRTPHLSFRNYDYNWEVGTRLTIRASALFGQVRAIAVSGQMLERADEVTIYGNFVFAPLLLLLMAALGARKHSAPGLALNCGVGCALLLIVILYFMRSA